MTTTAVVQPTSAIPARTDSWIPSVATWLLSRSVLVLSIRFAVEQDALADVAGYFDWARGAWLHGVLPGRDFPSEYPPGALPLILLPAVGHGPFGYLRWFASVLMIVDGMFLLCLLRRAKQTSDRTGLRLWTWGPLLVGPIFLERFDLVPGVLAALALASLATRPARAGALIVLATAVKVWPAALVPLLGAAPRHRRRALCAVAATSALVLAISSLAGVSHAWRSTFEQQGGRGLHVEAVAATPFDWWRRLGGPHPIFRHGAWEVNGAAARTVGGVVWTVGMLLIVGLVLVLARRLAAGVTSDLPLAGAAVVACLLVVDKALSPQYLVWLLAILAVATTQCFPHRRAVVALALGTLGLTQIVYPLMYTPFLRGALAPLLALSLRNASLCVIAFLLVRAALARPLETAT